MKEEIHCITNKGKKKNGYELMEKDDCHSSSFIQCT